MAQLFAQGTNPIASAKGALRRAGAAFEEYPANPSAEGRARFLLDHFEQLFRFNYALHEEWAEVVSYFARASPTPPTQTPPVCRVPRSYIGPETGTHVQFKYII